MRRSSSWCWYLGESGWKLVYGFGWIKRSDLQLRLYPHSSGSGLAGDLFSWLLWSDERKQMSSWNRK